MHPPLTDRAQSNFRFGCYRTPESPMFASTSPDDCERLHLEPIWSALFFMPQSMELETDGLCGDARCERTYPHRNHRNGIWRTLQLSNSCRWYLESADKSATQAGRGNVDQSYCCQDKDEDERDLVPEPHLDPFRNL